MKETILYVHAADEMYGSDVVLLSLLQAMQGTVYEPFVVLPNDMTSELPPEMRLSGRLSAGGIAVTSMPLAVMRRKYFTPSGALVLLRRSRSSAHAVLRQLNGRKVALVHSHTAAVLTGAVCARLLGVPHVWHVSEIVERPALVRRFISWVVTRHADHIVAVSRAVRDHLAATQPAVLAKCHVIYNGIDPTPFAAADGQRVRAALAPEGVSRPIVGMIGRLGTWKGQELLLEATVRVARERPDVLVLFIGGVLDGETRQFELLQQRAVAAGVGDNVIVQGYRTDVPEVLAALDVFVQPSLRPEPFSLTVLEAMASGRPVVATDHGGPRELVLDGETGYLTPPGDPAAMADAILRLLRDEALRRRMGEAGRRRMVQEFSLETFNRRSVALYESLLASDRRPDVDRSERSRSVFREGSPTPPSRSRAGPP